MPCGEPCGEPCGALMNRARPWLTVFAVLALSQLANGQPVIDQHPNETHAASSGYQEQWRIVLRYASGLALDSQGQPWVLVSKPPSIIRLSPTGEEAQKIELGLPAGRPASYLDHRELSILTDGSFLVADMRYRPDGSYVGRYENGGYVFSLSLDQALYATRFDRVRRLNLADGRIEFEFGKLGVAPDRLLSPGRVVSDGQRLVLVDAGALKVFDAQGVFQFALNGLLRKLPANHMRSWTRTSLALDDRGLLYVAVAERGEVVILDTEYRPLGRLQMRIPLAVATAGESLYALTGAGRSAGVVAFRRTADAAPMNPGNPLPRQTEETQLLAVAAPEQLIIPWRRGRGHEEKPGDQGRIVATVVGPDDPSIRWLATAGGLIREGPDSAARRVWTTAEGLPGNSVQSLWVDTRSRYLWIATNRGLARLALDDLDAGPETVGTGEPRATSAGGFAGPGGTPVSVWFWNEKGLYDLRAEDSEASRFEFPEPIRSLLAEPVSGTFLLTDGLRLWRFDPVARQLELLLTTDTLNDLRTRGPQGLPDLRELSWLSEPVVMRIGTFRHGAFQHDLRSGDTRELDD